MKTWYRKWSGELFKATFALLKLPAFAPPPPLLIFVGPIF